MLLLLLLLAAVWTWSPADWCCKLTAEPRSQNIATCFAITALLSGLVPRSAPFSSLLTLRTRSLLDLTSSCVHKYATSMCLICHFLVCGGCVRWPSHQWPTLASSRNPDSSPTTQFLSIQTLLMLQHTALLLRYFLQIYNVCACVLAGCDCRTVSHLRLMNFEFLCSLPTLNLKMPSLLQPFFHT